jgi:hypothetical protein
MSQDAASIDLELNAKQMYSELQVAEKKYNDGMNRMGQGANRLGSAHEGLTVRTKAAGRQIHNFAQDLASGADAATLLSDGLMGVGKSLGLSLGALAGLGIGAVAVMKIHEIQKEYAAVNKEVEKLTAPRASANYQSLTDLEGHLNKVSAALAKLREEQSGGADLLTGQAGPGILQDLKDFAYDAFSGGKPYARAQRKSQIDALSASGESDEAGIIGKGVSDLAGRRDALNGEPDFITKAKKLEAEAMQNLHQGIDAVVIDLKKLQMSFEEMAQAVSEKRKERVQRTLGEIAGTPDVMGGVATEESYKQWQAGRAARAAQQWDALAESRRLGGDMQGAQDAFNTSTEIKRGIPGLKESEKDLKGEFLGALDASTILKQIEANTKTPPVNR